MCQIVAKHVLVMKAKDSTLEIKHFVKERWDPLLTMTIQVMSKQCRTRWTWTSEFQDYHILLWSMRRVQAFENWFRKLRTTQTDTLFNKIYDKIKPENPFSPESKKMIQEVGNIELFELLETDPKTQCKACLSYWNVGIVCYTCGHFLQETEANRGFIKYTMDLAFNSIVRHQEGKTSRPQIWENARRQRILSGKPVEEEMQKEKVPRNSWPILIRSCFPCSNDWKQSRWRSLSTMGCSCRWRSHLSSVRRRNTSTTRTNGGSISISRVLTPYHWENVLNSSKRCLP